MSIPVKTIAGQKSGIPVTIHADLYPLFQAIKQASLQGNHWARICESELSALSSGHIRKSVYLKNNGRQEEFGEFTIILPGCKASFRKNAAGMFYIYSLEADANYTELQRSQEKPGLYRAKKYGNEWKIKFESNGNIQERKNNLVAISDRLKSVNDAINLASSALIDSKRATEGGLESNGFDLHFTPGKNCIGGLRNVMKSYSADTNLDLHESALLLAGTMQSSRNIKDVSWVSERGGSGVLTQAMRILKDRGVNFRDTGHKTFFSKLQTNLGNAEQLARDIGLDFDGQSHSKELINVNQLFGSGLANGFINPVKRYVKEDKYSALNMVSDISKEVGEHKSAYASVVGTGALAAGFKASAVGLAAAATAMTGPGMVFGAVLAAAGASVAVYKGVNAVGKSYFPLAYHKKK